MAHPSYKGKVASSGNSRALRLESGFFKALPRFASGSDIVAESISDDVVIIRAGSRKERGKEDDPVMSVFLSYLENDMLKNPQHIEPMTTAELDEIAELVEGVEID